MVLDSRFTAALHVETLRRNRVWEHLEPHVLFQASTIGALLEGRYDGDVTFAELAEHGDLGLGTLNALDGEMIALDGRFYRADVDGRITEIEPTALTPFAVVVPFQASVEARFASPMEKDDLLAALEKRIPPGSGACAIRIDGDFERVHARSVPRQEPPYRPLAEVVEDQHVFDLPAGPGTIVGFRFPDHGEASRSPAFIFTSSPPIGCAAATCSTSQRPMSPRGSTRPRSCTSSSRQGSN